MIKLLYKHSKWFRATVNKLWTLPQSELLKGTEFAFVDGIGRKYYRYIDDMEIPIIRKGQIQLFVTELSRCLDKDEIGLFMKALETQIEAALSQPKNVAQVSKYLATISHLVTEMKLREDNILHPVLLMDMAAIMFIREDENPFEFNHNLHKEKVETFRNDVSEKIGLYDFFVQARLDAYIPFLKESRQGFKDLYLYLEREIQANNLAIGQLYTTGQNFTPNGKNKN